jgi:hypothetical protein
MKTPYYEKNAEPRSSFSTLAYARSLRERPRKIATQSYQQKICVATGNGAPTLTG